VLSRFTLVALLLTTSLAAAAASAAPSRSAVAAKTIASAASSDFRAELVARRTSGGAAPAATVTLTTYARSEQGWQRLESRHLGGSYFWKTLTGGRSICRFELATARRPHVTVQLLVSPALGCGKTETMTLRVP
jgi:hypothetical protein